LSKLGTFRNANAVKVSHPSELVQYYTSIGKLSENSLRESTHMTSLPATLKLSRNPPKATIRLTLENKPTNNGLEEFQKLQHTTRWSGRGGSVKERALLHGGAASGLSKVYPSLMLHHRTFLAMAAAASMLATARAFDMSHSRKLPVAPRSRVPGSSQKSSSPQVASTTRQRWHHVRLQQERLRLYGRKGAGANPEEKRREEGFDR